MGNSLLAAFKETLGGGISTLRGLTLVKWGGDSRVPVEAKGLPVGNEVPEGDDLTRMLLQRGELDPVQSELRVLVEPYKKNPPKKHCNPAESIHREG